MRRFEVRFYSQLSGEVVTVELSSASVELAGGLALAVIAELDDEVLRERWWRQGVVVESARESVARSEG